MKNYRLSLIRHGYTQGNIEGKYIGRTDLPLCDEGEGAIASLSASELYPRVQKVYTSPLKRCTQTAEIIYPNNLIKRIDKMRECDFGDFEGKTPDELAHLPEYEEWLKGGYASSPPNGENYGDFTLRCLEGLDEIFHDMMNNEVTDAAVVTHSGVIMNLLSSHGLPKGRPVDFATKQGEGFQIILTTFLWQKGNTFEIAGKLF
ncbi:MAG: histidine phosphatase family protein [Clostridiales bacterium]|nr:histidine phosphatase family protein [Clostridiales bacterium]